MKAELINAEVWTVTLKLGLRLDLALGWPDVNTFHIPEDPEMSPAPEWANNEGPIRAVFTDKPLDRMVSAHFQAAVRLYQGMLATGIPTDMAALVLPYSTVVEWTETRGLETYAKILSGETPAYTPMFALIHNILTEAFGATWTNLLESAYAQ
jgi:hypothetical protein